MQDCLGNEVTNFTSLPSMNGLKRDEKEKLFKELILDKTKDNNMIAVSVYKGTEIHKTVTSLKEFTKQDTIKFGAVKPHIINREVKMLVGWNIIKK